MEILGLVLAVLYAGVMLFAVWKGKAKGKPPLFIAAGCFLVLAASLLSIVWESYWIAVLILGMAGISIGTFLNGRQQKEFHIQHHIIRLVVEAVIVMICWIGIS